MIGRSGAAAVSSALAALAILGCDDVVRNTELKPEGPPEVLQVFARERITVIDEEGKMSFKLVPRIAYGDHPDISTDDDDRVVTNAVAGTDQKIRIVVDELLRGNFIEEIACADKETWSQVPVGTDPDDIARCTGADLSKCKDLCIGPGGPIGILDENGDRAVDATRMIEGVVTLSCGGVAVPIEQDESFYQPSGNQLIPAGDLNIDGLGPAIVVRPAESLPTGGECTIALAPTVVDKSGIQPCAPAAGGSCNPGDIAAVHFTVEELQLLTTSPADGDHDVDLTTTDEDAEITVTLNGFVDPATAVATGFTITAGDAPLTEFAIGMSEHDPAAVVITVPGGFQPETSYSLTVASGDAGLKDKYGAALSASPTITWTTKAAETAHGAAQRGRR